MGCLYVTLALLVAILCVLVVIPVAGIVWVLSALLLIVWLPFYSAGYGFYIGLLLFYSYLKQGVKCTRRKHDNYH